MNSFWFLFVLLPWPAAPLYEAQSLPLWSRPTQTSVPPFLKKLLLM